MPGGSALIQPKARRRSGPRVASPVGSPHPPRRPFPQPVPDRAILGCGLLIVALDTMTPSARCPRLGPAAPRLTRAVRGRLERAQDRIDPRSERWDASTPRRKYGPTRSCKLASRAGSTPTPPMGPSPSCPYGDRPPHALVDLWQAGCDPRFAARRLDLSGLDELLNRIEALPRDMADLRYPADAEPS